jgi:beta-lactamase regulating signal transducer with metallopeptidase domain
MQMGFPAFLAGLIERSLAMSVLILTYLAVTPLLEKRYAAKWRYRAWTVIVLGLLIPFRLPLDGDLFRIDLQVPEAGMQQMISIGSGPDASADPARPHEDPEPRRHLWAGGLWTAGAAAAAAYFSWRHWRFLRLARRWSEEITDPQILALLQELKKELGIARPVALRACSCLTSPMLTGLFRPAILLPPALLTHDGLPFILKHELVHLQNHDLWRKGLVMLAAAVHWFNPAIYLMARAIDVQCELACDERVLQGANLRQRRKYGETILRVVRNGSIRRTWLTTNFYGGKKEMEKRIHSIMETAKKRTGVAVFGIVLLATIATGVTFVNHSAATASDERPAAASGEPGAGSHASMDFYEAYLTKVEDDPVRYYYNGRWVRSLYDEDTQSGRKVLFINAVEDADVPDTPPVYLRTVRNGKTGEIEGLAEMSGSEAFQLMEDDQVQCFVMFVWYPQHHAEDA